MHIILMRHGEAVSFAPNDADRILTPTGKSQATTIGSQLKRGGWNPEAIYCSTRIRAQQTAELVIDAAGLDVTATSVEGITPEDDWVNAMAVIEKHASNNSLFVFHQPILTQIVGHLTEDDPWYVGHPRGVPATAYILQLDAFLPSAATLVGSYQP
ncbi:MAG TPA: phosphohistidine phosphatase SixA [Gammaproteobacteria bacterium]|nr:phosphohistidine phosphatase SixA [Gammaproteobacteria bacterium]